MGRENITVLQKRIHFFKDHNKQNIEHTVCVFMKINFCSGVQEAVRVPSLCLEGVLTCSSSLQERQYTLYLYTV